MRHQSLHRRPSKSQLDKPMLRCAFLHNVTRLTARTAANQSNSLFGPWMWLSSFVVPKVRLHLLCLCLQESDDMFWAQTQTESSWPTRRHINSRLYSKKTETSYSSGGNLNRASSVKHHCVHRLAEQSRHIIVKHVDRIMWKHELLSSAGVSWPGAFALLLVQ